MARNEGYTMPVPEREMRVIPGFQRQGIFSSAELPMRQPSKGWASAVVDAIALQPAYQALEETYAYFNQDEYDPSYDPFTEGELDGYEPYLSEFVGSYNQADTMRIKAKIDRNNAMRQRTDEELGLGGFAVSEIFNIANIIPIPALRGVGKGLAAFRGSTSFTAVVAAEEALRHQVDPTARMEESLVAVATAPLFGGLIGGIAGIVGKDVNRVAAEYAAEFSRIQRADPRLLPADQEPFLQSTSNFTARPTGPEGAGIAPVIGGLEKVSFSLYSRLKNTEIRSVGDFVDAMLGTYGTKATQNAAGVVTESSVTMAAGVWRGMAADTMRGIEEAYVRYRGGEGGMRFADMNVPILKERAAGLIGRRPPEGILSYDEFKALVFRAHKSDELVSDNPFILEAAGHMRILMNNALEGGVKSGLIVSPEGLARAAENKLIRGKQIAGRIAEFEAKESLTNQEKAALALMRKSSARIIDGLERSVWNELDSPGLDELINGIVARQLAARVEKQKIADSITGKAGKRQQAIEDRWQAYIDRIERDRALLDYFNSLEQEGSIGLTKAQADFRDALQKRLDEADADAPNLDGGTAARMDEELWLDSAWAPKEIPWDVRLQNWLDRRRYAAQDTWRRTVTGKDHYTTDMKTLLSSEKIRGRMTAEQRALADEILPFIDDDIKTWVGNPFFNEPRHLGWMETAGPGDQISAKLRGTSSKQDIETLLHEASHVAYISRYGFLFKSAEDLGPEALRLKGELEGLFKDAESRSGAKKQYGMTNVDEFVAEALTSSKFRKWLKGEGLLARWWAHFRSMIGMKPAKNPNEDILESVFSVLEDLRTEMKGAPSIESTFRNPNAYSRNYNTSRAAWEKFMRENGGATPSRKGGAGPEAPAGRMDNMDDYLTVKEAKYLRSLNDQLNGIYKGMTGPKNEKFYLPRYWLIDEVLADEAGSQELRRILTKWFKDNPKEGVPTNDKAIAGRVDQSIAAIVKDAELGEMQLMKGNGSPSFTKHRGLDIPNELVADFIENDVEKIVRTYATRFGELNEMASKFGDVDDSIEDVLIQSALELSDAELPDLLNQLEGLRKDLTLAKDKVTGAVYSQEPEAMAKRRHAGVLKAYGTATSLGGAMLSSIPEAARAMMVHGFARTMDATMLALSNPEAFRAVTKEMMTQTGEGLDVIFSTGFSRYVEQGGPTGMSSSRAGQAAHKFTDAVNGPYFVANLLAPWTDWTKRMNLFYTNQFMLEDIAKFVETGDKKLGEKLASYGISADDAAGIMKQPLTKEGTILKSNLENWTDDQLALRYRSAVGGMVRRIIPTAGLDDIPEIAKGFVKGREYPLITLPFQFMNYGFAAVNKVMLSALQGRDQNAMSGLFALMAFGYMVEFYKAPDFVWEKMTATERAVRAFDRSGIAGIYSDIPTMVETATLGNIGVRPLLGLEPYGRNEDYLDAAGGIGGPVAGRAADIVRLFVDEDTSAEDIGGTVRRSIPINSLFYLKNLVRDMEGSITDRAKPEPAEEPDGP